MIKEDSYLQGPGILEDVFLEYDMTVEDVEQVNENLWKLSTDRGIKGLKRESRGEPRLRYIHSIQEHLAERGLRSVVRFIRTKHGLPYAFGEPGEQYVLFDWLDGKHPDLGRAEHRQAATKMLAKMHLCCEGLQPMVGSANLNNWGNWVKKFQYRSVELLENALIAGRKEELTEIDNLYKQHMRYFYQQSLEALNLLDSNHYEKLISKESAAGCFCHRDFGARNLLLDSQWEMYVIDFEHAISDLRIYDLGRYLRTLTSRHNWDWDVGQEILDTYTLVRPISLEEQQVLLAFMTFPRMFWLYSVRYYNQDERYQLREIRDKFRQCLEEEGQRVTFLNQLAKYSQV